MSYAIWSLPLDANRGEVRGGLRRITSGPFDVMPAISLDGKWLVFATARGKKISPQNVQVDVKDVDSGAETVISDAPTAEADPQISSDGSAISLDTIGPGEARGILVGERRNLAWRGIPGKHAWDWSHDKRRMLYNNDDGGIRCLDIASGKDVFYIADPAYSLYQAKFAPDDKFMAMEAVDRLGSRLFVLPIARNVPASSKDWIAIDYADSWDDKPRWSPDGNLLYSFRIATAICAFGRSGWMVNPNGL